LVNLFTDNFKIMKEKYLTPLISITEIFIESGILGGSGIAIISNQDGMVYEEWNEDTEDRDIDW